MNNRRNFGSGCPGDRFFDRSFQVPSGKGMTMLPLGGGSQIGASCYLLQFNGHNLMLDAGVLLDEMDCASPWGKPRLSTGIERTFS